MTPVDRARIELRRWARMYRSLYRHARREQNMVVAILAGRAFERACIVRAEIRRLDPPTALETQLRASVKREQLISLALARATLPTLPEKAAND